MSTGNYTDTRELIGRPAPLGHVGFTLDGALLCHGCMSCIESREATALYQTRQTFGSEVAQWAVQYVSSDPAELSDDTTCAHCYRTLTALDTDSA